MNAIAAGTGLLQSPEASATYTLTTQVATPIFNPAAGYYTTVQSVTIRTTTPGATIYYTTDGTTPTKPPTTTIFRHVPVPMNCAAMLNA